MIMFISNQLTRINIVYNDEDLSLEIPSNAPIHVFFMQYSEMINVPLDRLHFYYDTEIPLQCQHSASDLGMKNGDTIIVRDVAHADLQNDDNATNIIRQNSSGKHSSSDVLYISFT